MMLSSKIGSGTGKPGQEPVDDIPEFRPEDFSAMRPDVGELVFQYFDQAENDILHIHLDDIVFEILSVF